jgi:hypothetical protein
MSGCKGGKWQEETLLTYPTPSQPFPNLIQPINSLFDHLFPCPKGEFDPH